MIERFDLPVTEADLADLRARLRATRWPSPATHPTQGIGLDEVRELCAYWAEGYDWQRTAARLTSLGGWRTVVDGLGLTFWHLRSPRPGGFPLILTHGWPGSVVEYLEAAQLLCDNGFDCVVPSLPGYGWSDQPTEPGWGIERIARAWAALMAALGYRRYGAVGSDWGTSVTAALGQVDADHVAGIHLVPPLVPGGVLGESDEDGYSTQQRTRPQTIGYALTDSPAALAAWITEKVRAWSDPRSRISVDAQLDNLMFYWLPRAGASAARLYWESSAQVNRWLTGPLAPSDLVHVPAGASVFPYELQRPTRDEAATRFTDLRYWGEPEIGGHFAAWEEPALFAGEVTAFFDLIR